MRIDDLDTFKWECPNCKRLNLARIQEVDLCTVECGSKNCRGIEFCLSLNVRVEVLDVSVHPNSRNKICREKDGERE